MLVQGEQTAKQGHVVHHKNRPHVVISDEKVIQVTKRVALAPISTAPWRFIHEVAIPNDNTTGLRDPSKVMSNQIRTVSLESCIKKIGSISEQLSQLNRALGVALGAFSTTQKPTISRGDIVQIVVEGVTYKGVIISNDIGNHASKIATVVQTHAFQAGDSLNEFDLVAEGSGSEKWLVECYNMNTFSYEVMECTGSIGQQEMEKINAMLSTTVGFYKAPS